jgi:hypothetical protein
MILKRSVINSCNIVAVSRLTLSLIDEKLYIIEGSILSFCTF